MDAPADCEICGSPTSPYTLRGGAVLDRCGRCGHLRRDLAAAPAQHREHAYGGEPTLDTLRLELTFRLLRAHGPRRPGSVFEIGHGEGSLLRRFGEHGARLAGTDPDQLERSVDPRVRAVADLRSVPVEEIDDQDGAHDLVYGVHVAEHVLDPLRTLGVAARLLRPGGTLQLLTPAGDSLGPRLYGQAWWMLEDPTHVRFFTADSLARAATAAGLTQVEVRRPVLDSLVTDAASVARMLRRTPAPGGVLATRGVIAAAAVGAPPVLGLRAASSRARPTLHLVARRPS